MVSYEYRYSGRVTFCSLYNGYFFGMFTAFMGLIATKIMVRVPNLLKKNLKALQGNEGEVNSKKKLDNFWIFIFVIVAGYLFYTFILPIFFNI